MSDDLLKKASNWALTKQNKKKKNLTGGGPIRPWNLPLGQISFPPFFFHFEIK